MSDFSYVSLSETLVVKRDLVRSVEWHECQILVKFHDEISDHWLNYIDEEEAEWAFRNICKQLVGEYYEGAWPKEQAPKM